MDAEWQAKTSTPRHSQQYNRDHRGQHIANERSFFHSRASIYDVPSTIAETLNEPNDDSLHQTEEILDNKSIVTAVKKRRNSLRRRHSLNRHWNRQAQNRREQRIMAYSRFRRIEEQQQRKSLVMRRIIRRSSAGVVSTPPIYFKSNDVDFQLSQVNIETADATPVTIADANRNFEQLLAVKPSENPFDPIAYPEPLPMLMPVIQTPSTSLRSRDRSCYNASGLSANSTMACNHRAGGYVNAHKIPHVVRYGTQNRRSFNNNTNNNTNNINNISPDTNDSQASYLGCHVNNNILDMIICSQSNPTFIVLYSFAIAIIAIQIYILFQG